MRVRADRHSSLTALPRGCIEPARAVVFALVCACATAHQIYGFCLDAPDRQPRVVMQYCASGSLDKYLQQLLNAGSVRGAVVCRPCTVSSVVALEGTCTL